jgi:hypothetical protein
LLNEDTANKNGTRYYTTYDPYNTVNYSQVVDIYDTQNRQASQNGVRDDAGFGGYTWITTFDAANNQA